MSILAIDYGTKYLGFAVGFDNGVSSPVGTSMYSHKEEAVKEIKQYIDTYHISQIVIGLPLKKGGETAQTRKTCAFGLYVKETFDLQVRFIDETLTSHDAVDAMIQAGVPKTKRKQMEHAFSAKLILDSVLRKCN